ncbi:hypothetical protein LCGC14_2834240, partial [marine sediment metagenome]
MSLSFEQKMLCDLRILKEHFEYGFDIIDKDTLINTLGKLKAHLECMKIIEKMKEEEK